MAVGHSIEYHHKTSLAETNTQQGQHYWSPSVLNLNFGLCFPWHHVPKTELRFILGRRKLVYDFMTGEDWEKQKYYRLWAKWIPVKVGHLMFITQRYTCIFKKIYWAHFWEKLGNQSKRVCQGKGLNTGFSTEVQWLVTWDQALFSFHFKNNIPAGKVEF